MDQDSILTCPHCGGHAELGAVVCPHCQKDLSLLARPQYEHVIHYNEALSLARAGELDLARARLWMAIERNAAFAPCHILLAKVNARLGRWSEAKESARRAMELAPDDEQAVGLLSAVERAEEEASTAQLRHQERIRNARVQALERYASQHQTELALAFGAGASIVALLGLGVRVLFGRKARSRG